MVRGFSHDPFWSSHKRDDYVDNNYGIIIESKPFQPHSSSVPNPRQRKYFPQKIFTFCRSPLSIQCCAFAHILLLIVEVSKFFVLSFTNIFQVEDIFHSSFVWWIEEIHHMLCFVRHPPLKNNAPSRLWKIWSSLFVIFKTRGSQQEK